jgi:simple sugar transport system substrate-binding protein
MRSRQAKKRRPDARSQCVRTRRSPKPKLLPFEICAPNSAWVATAATNPAVVGAVSVRAVALLLAGQESEHHIVVKPTLITRDDLVKNNIRTIAELGEKFPAFRSSDAATAAWIPVAN